jgi:hypothetical protein
VADRDDERIALDRQSELPTVTRGFSGTHRPETY